MLGRADHHRRGWSARAYLLLVLGAALVIGIGALIYGYLWSVRQATSSTTDHMSFRAEKAGEAIDAELALASKQIEAVASQHGLEAAFGQSDCTLTTGGGEVFTTSRIDLVSPTGVVGCSSEPAVTTLAAPHAGASWLTKALASAGVLRLWEQDDPVTGQPSIAVTSRFLGANGSVAGAAVLFLREESVASALARDLRAGDDGVITIVDAAGSVVSTSASGTDRYGATYPSTLGHGVWADLDGTRRIISSSAVPGTGWTVYAGIADAPVVAAATGVLSGRPWSAPSPCSSSERAPG